MATDLPIAAVSPQATTSTTRSEAASFDERWTAWQDKGAAHDRAVRRRMAIAAPILIVAAVIIFALVVR